METHNKYSHKYDKIMYELLELLWKPLSLSIFLIKDSYVPAKCCCPLHTAGSHYCCTAQDSLNGDQLTDQFEA